MIPRKDQAGVGPAKPEGIGHGMFNPGFAHHVGYIIKIAFIASE